MNTGFLYGTNEIIIFVVFCAFMLAATDMGFGFGRRFETRTPDKTKSQIPAVEDEILGILALLLGITMFRAVSGFDARKRLVLNEANAIGTSLHRTALLPAPDGSKIASFLRQYVAAMARIFLQASPCDAYQVAGQIRAQLTARCRRVTQNRGR